MCYRVEVQVHCEGGVSRQQLAPVLTMLGPGTIGVRGTPDGWTAVIHFHAASAESAKSMAVTRIVNAACNAQLPPPLSLSCEATPEVDDPSDRTRRPFLSWTASSAEISRSPVLRARRQPALRTRVAR
jgi:hypothetical protein